LLLATFALAYALPVGCPVMADGLWPNTCSARRSPPDAASWRSRRCVSGGREGARRFLLLTLGWLLLPGAAALPLLLALGLELHRAFFERYRASPPPAPRC